MHSDLVTFMGPPPYWLHRAGMGPFFGAQRPGSLAGASSILSNSLKQMQAQSRSSRVVFDSLQGVGFDVGVGFRSAVSVRSANVRGTGRHQQQHASVKGWARPGEARREPLCCCTAVYLRSCG